MTEEELRAIEKSGFDSYQADECINRLIAEVRRLQGQLRVSNTGILQLNTDNERLLRVARAAKEYREEAKCYCDSFNTEGVRKCPVCRSLEKPLDEALEAAIDLMGEG